MSTLNQKAELHSTLRIRRIFQNVMIKEMGLT